MELRKIRIATRGSKLAVYQAELVARYIEDNNPGMKTEISIINTRGDRILDVSLSKIGDKGLFTRELESALKELRADVAVHSLKDLPTEMPAGLILGGVLKRGEARDALVSHREMTHEDLSNGIRVGTSSLRRIAQLKIHFPGVEIVDIRGNVDTRIRKMKEGTCDAMVMAAAGLQRLNLAPFIRELLDPEIMIPAAGQGAICMQIREDDPFMKEIIAGVSDRFTHLCVLAERTFLNLMEGGCQIPIGCYSETRYGKLILTGFVSDTDGRNPIILSKEGSLDHPEEAANELAEDFLKAGAGEIIQKIKQQAYG